MNCNSINICDSNKTNNRNKTNNFLKKIFIKIKDNLMSDDIKNEIKNELIEPFYVEIRNFILPHYLIFMILFLIIIILLFYIILTISNIKN